MLALVLDRPSKRVRNLSCDYLYNALMIFRKRLAMRRIYSQYADQLLSLIKGVLSSFSKQVSGSRDLLRSASDRV